MVPRASAFVRTITVTLIAIMIAGPGWAKNAVEGAAAAIGDLSVETDPNGAAVYVDGRLAGATPVSVSGISAGEHRVRVVKSGYLENARLITVTAGKPTAVKVKMTRTAEASGRKARVSTRAPHSSSHCRCCPRGRARDRCRPRVTGDPTIV